jgi:hypothetical protein
MSYRNNRILIFIIALIFIGLPWNPVLGRTAKRTDYLIGGKLGYFNGIGGIAELTISRRSRSFPIAFHFGVGYFNQEDPGSATAARRIFINDNTGGNDNIKEYGQNWLFCLDASYPVLTKQDFVVRAYGGARYVRYTAHFDYQGGNEAFDVYSNPWGVGLGLRMELPFSTNYRMGLDLGFDYYIPNTLRGHGNFYNPTNDDDNPRDDYTYSDADNAVNQPKYSPRAVLYIQYLL